jgi:Fe-S oxidoreductase
MRAIAEEAAELVRRYKGSYSGEHGDGLVRSEWIAPFFGPKLTQAFGEIKDCFDPKGLLNPGKIVRPSKQDDRSLFRYKPDYRTIPIRTALDWNEWGGFDKAVEMCNNNGHCRKFDAGTMCPSYRVTREEQHLTRGRANTLRLALSGQLPGHAGEEALSSDAVRAALDLCVSCKGCRRECPTGVDMAMMKVEFLYHYHKRHGLNLKDRLVAYLPRYSSLVARFSSLVNPLQQMFKGHLGFAPQRSLPAWRSDFFNEGSLPFKGVEPHPHPVLPPEGEGENGRRAAPSERRVVLMIDTFNRYFEPENARAALAVLNAAGYEVHLPRAADGGRPLCCGRTFLASGLVDEARVEARRMLEALRPALEQGIPIIGLEPSCLLGLRDEFLSMLPGDETGKLAGNTYLFEEFLAREAAAGRLNLALKPLAQKKALLHGHCHQKAFALMPDVQRALELVPDSRWRWWSRAAAAWRAALVTTPITTTCR